MPKKGWDLTSTNSLRSAAEWIRKNAGASFVLVVREHDAAFATDGKLTPFQVTEMLRQEQPRLTQALLEQREALGGRTR